MNPGFWRDRPVLVTGCSGFLGSWLSLRLVEAGAAVVGLVRDFVPTSNFVLGRIPERITVVRGSVEDFDLVQRTLNEYEIDTCFHLAAQAIVGTANRSPLSTFETNIAGTWRLLEAVRQTATVRRLVVASSDKAYGVYPEARLPYHEDYPVQGSYPYDASKACADLIARCYAQTYWDAAGPALAVTRCGNLYGAGDVNLGRIVPDVLTALAQGEPPVIRSHGKHVRDFLYVLDAVDAYLTLAEQVDGHRGEAWNFGSEKPVSVLDLVQCAIAATGVDVAPVVRGTSPAPGEILSQYLDCAKARTRLGWTPKVELTAGLQAAWPWYRHWVTASGETDFAALNRRLLESYEET